MYVQIDLPHVGLLESKVCIGTDLGKVEEFWGDFPPKVPVTHLQHNKHMLLDIRLLSNVFDFASHSIDVTIL